MKQRKGYEDELIRAHRSKQEQKIEFEHLSKKLKDVKEELFYVEIISKESSIPKGNLFIF